jgi:hypothetical protein
VNVANRLLKKLKNINNDILLYEKTANLTQNGIMRKGCITSTIRILVPGTYPVRVHHLYMSTRASEIQIKRILCCVQIESFHF